MSKKPNEERKPIQKLDVGTYQFEGIIPNEKSIYQPSYILFGKDGNTYSTSGHLAKQLEKFEDRLYTIEFEITVENLFDKRFKKIFLNLVELKKLKDKEKLTSQVKLTGF